MQELDQLLTEALQASQDTGKVSKEGKVIDHEDEIQTELPGVKPNVTILEGSV